MSQEDIAERVQAVLSNSGLSQRQFAARLGLDPSQVSRSLHGQRRFTSLELAKVAEVGAVSVDWLLGVETTWQTAARGAIQGRSEAAEAVRLATAVVQMRLDLAELGAVEPALTVPQWRLRGSMIAQGLELAGGALTHGDVGDDDASAVRDLPALLERAFGIDVAVRPLAEGVDGVQARSGLAAAVVVAAGRLLPRQRFTIAHELAHVLCDDDQGLHVDVSSGQGRPDLTEVRANSFAAAFLMPEPLLRRRAREADAVDEPLLDDLVEQLVVSPATLAHRMHNLGLVSEQARDEYKRNTLRTVLLRNGRADVHSSWMDEAARTRVPLRLLADLWTAYERGDVTLRPIAQLLERDPGELRDESDWSGPAPEAYSLV